MKNMNYALSGVLIAVDVQGIGSGFKKPRTC
jgi:hypothetical protein